MHGTGKETFSCKITLKKKKIMGKGAFPCACPTCLAPGGFSCLSALQRHLLNFQILTRSPLPPIAAGSSLDPPAPFFAPPWGCEGAGDHLGPCPAEARGGR